MPKLLIFVPCERVIISSEDNSASLITLLHGFKLGRAERQPTDDEPLSLPIRWTVFNEWQRLAEDEGQTYEQKVELFAPSGRSLLSQATEFVMTKSTHRVTGVVFGFPITGFGIHQLRLSLRAAGAEFRVIEEYQITIDMEGSSEPASQRQSETTARST